MWNQASPARCRETEGPCVGQRVDLSGLRFGGILAGTTSQVQALISPSGAHGMRSPHGGIPAGATVGGRAAFTKLSEDIKLDRDNFVFIIW